MPDRMADRMPDRLEGVGGRTPRPVGQDAAVHLDHVSYAVAPDEFIDTVQRLGSALGAPLVDGGRHPRFGTRNFILPLADRTYLDVVTTLDHPAAEAVPFRRAVKARADLGGGWLGWVVSTDDLAPLEARLGREAVEGHRVRPDGHDLRWRQIGVNGLLADPQLPFFVQWLGEPDQHPSAAARPGLSLVRLEIAGDPAIVEEWLGEPRLHPLDTVEVDWVDTDDGVEPGLVAVTFRTPRGDVRID